MKWLLVFCALICAYRREFFLCGIGWLRAVLVCCGLVVAVMSFLVCEW